jgi:hypothetical protein
LLLIGILIEGKCGRWKLNGTEPLKSFSKFIGICGNKSRSSPPHAMSSKVPRTESQVCPIAGCSNVKGQFYSPRTAVVGMSVPLWLELIKGGLKYGDEMINDMKQLAPLKTETDMGDCADAFVMLAKNGIPFIRAETNVAKKASRAQR